MEMKRFCLLFLFFLPLAVIAQTPVKIYGNLDLENVNISVLNTQYGTSTDARGNYSLLLFAKDKSVDLLYSSIGYCDTVVSLIPRQLQQDSLNVSFRMREKEYDLPEAGIVANRDFYRTERGRRIADIAFADDRILVLENRKDKSNLMVLNAEGETVSQAQYDSLYTKIHIDCFGDYILVGENFCQQIYFDEACNPLLVSRFSRKSFDEKLQNLLFEFHDAYIFRSQTYHLDWLVHKDHNQSQTYFCVMKNDTLHEKKMLVQFYDAEAMKVCQSVLSEIISIYNQVVPENENVFVLGTWKGSLAQLAEPKLDLMKWIGWYENVAAVEYHTTALKFADNMQFIDLEKYQIVEVGKDFEPRPARELKVLSGKEFFKNQFLEDETTGNKYGLFIQNGISYVGLYNPETGNLGGIQKASNHIYPDVFKINGGYAYSVHFDKERQIGIMNRVKLN